MIPKCVKGNNMTILRPCSVQDVPNAPGNGYLVQESLESYQNGSSEVVVYRCRHGYELLGSDYSSCITDGYWSDLNITCQGVYLIASASCSLQQFLKKRCDCIFVCIVFSDILWNTANIWQHDHQGRESVERKLLLWKHAHLPVYRGLCYSSQQYYPMHFQR